MKIWGSITELVKVVFRSGGRETKLDAATQTGTQTDVTFRLPNLVNSSLSPVVAEIVEIDLAQVLTNKTIDGDLNTLQDISIASLKTVLGDANEALVRDAAGVVTSAKITNDNVDNGAGIVDTKLATISTAGKVSGSAITSGTIGGSTAVNTTGTVTASLFSGPLTGNVSGTATNVTGIVAKANGGTGADNSSVTFPATGTLVTRDATETLLNKTTVSSTGLVTGALTLPAGTEAERPSPIAGMIRYNTGSSAFEGYASGAWSGIGGGGTVDRVSQASHGFVIGDVLYLNGATYTKALAAAENTAEVVGMVSRVVDSGTFEITLSGEVAGLTGLVAGNVYFLSAATAGLATNVEPAIIGQVSVPIGVASTTTTMYVAPKRGVVLGGTNARTQLNLVSAAATQIFDAASPSLYTAGELTGWVQLGTSQKFYFRAPFAQNGGGTDWNISPSYVGDTPPAGFSITMASSGVITMTCPTFTGTGLVNYALNAPAVGATFPLAVDGGSLTTGTVAAARLPVASATADGVVNQVAQTFAGKKTLDGGALIKGDTSGVAIAAGYVGYRLYATQANNTTITLTTSYQTIAGSIVLGDGIWQIQYSAAAVCNPAAGLGNTVYTVCAIIDGAGAVRGESKSNLTYKNQSATDTGFIMANITAPSIILAITPSTSVNDRTLFLKAYKDASSVGIGEIRSNVGSMGQTSLWANQIG